MPEQAVERTLFAILAADIAGYSRLVGLDEEATSDENYTAGPFALNPEFTE